MEQSIKSEIDSIDKEIEALQQRKAQLQSSTVANETKSLDLDKLIESANAQLIAVLDNDRLSFNASKEGLIFEDVIFELRLYNSETQSNVIKLIANTNNAVKFITRILANAAAIDHIVSVLGDSIIDDSLMRGAIYVSTPNNALAARLSLSNEAGQFDVSVETRLLNDDDEVIITHEKHPSASIKVRGDISFAMFNYLRESVEYEDVYSVLNDADDAYDSFTVSTY